MVNTVCPNCNHEFETSKSLEKQIQKQLKTGPKSFTDIEQNVSASEATVFKYLEDMDNTKRIIDDKSKKWKLK